MKIKCLLVDDEPLALDLLENYVKKTPFLELLARCNNAIDALKYIENGDVDLLFLDIQMPELNGIEFSKIIKDRVKIIFTTAFEQYAIDGFRVNAIDYLLKPIGYVDFLVAANRAKELFGNKKEKSEKQSETIFVKSGYKLVQLDLKDVTYIEVLKDYVSIHLENGEVISTLMSLKSLENKLPAERFMRVHRSFIVNLEKIKTIERNRIIFGKDYIPISESYRDDFHRFVNDNFFG
jgi:DNA-binding LytR/AlgR family response regulator